MAATPGWRVLGVLQAELPTPPSGLAAVPSASVIVLNRDGRHHLDACLGAVLAEELPGGIEILLVDNGSGDGSVEHVRRRFPEVRILELGANLGFAAGNNRGMAAASGRHLVLLNNDTRARKGFLAALVSAADRHPRAGAIQAKLVFAARPDVIQSAGSLLLDDGSGGDRGFGERDQGQYDHEEEVFAACAAAVLYRRAALVDVGMFDQDFFMYYEDTDLGWRMRLRGWHAVYAPEAVVEHAHAGSSASGSALMRFHADRNRLFMLLKNAPPAFIWSAYRRLGRRAASTAAAAGHQRGRVLASFAAGAPSMLVKRTRIRARRTIPDAEVLRWARPRAEWDRRAC